MIYFIALCISALIGVIIGNLVNFKATRNQNIGHIIGLIVAVAIFVFLASDDGRALIVRTLADFNIRL